MPFNVESALRDGATEDQVLDYLRPLSKGYNVDLALKAGATKRQVIDYLAANSGVSAELASKSGSLDTPDEKGWWDSKSDMDKQIALDTAGEIVGGTAGAILGGAAGTPTGPLGTTAGASLGAGTGAALGKGAARLAGGAMGLKIPPQSIADKAAEYGVSFAAGALGEGLGRVAMAAGGATKAATKNAVRRGLRSADAAEIERLAREQGVPVRGAMLSRPVSIAEQALERFPTSRGVVQEAKQGAQKAWELSLDDVAGRIHGTAADDVATGRAMQRRQEANRAAARKHYRKQYGEVSKEVGDQQIDLVPMRNAAVNLDSSMPAGLWNYFPQGTVSKIKRAARIGEAAEAPPMAAVAGADNATHMASLNDIARSQTRGRSYVQLGEVERAEILNLARRAGAVPQDFAPAGGTTSTATPATPDITVPQAISFDEAVALRTELLEAERAIRVAQARGNAPAFDTRAIIGLRASLDRAIDLSLRSRPKALAKWREVNKQYRETSRAIQPGSGVRGQGNPMAREIETEVYPERLPRQATASATPFTETQRALGDPPNVPPPTDVPDPTPMVRRNYAERMVDDARTQDPMIGEDRYVNPRALERRMEKSAAKGGQEILGPEAWRRYQEAIKVGKASNPRDVNTSGTVYGTEAIREARNIGRGVTAAGSGMLAGAGLTATAMGGGIPGAATIAAGLVAPRYIAKAVTGPRLTRFLTAAPENVAFRPGGPIAGAIGRVVAHATEPRTWLVTDPNGKTWQFKSRGAAEAFSKNAGLRNYRESK